MKAESEKNIVSQKSGNAAENSFSNTNRLILQNRVFYSYFY